VLLLFLPVTYFTELCIGFGYLYHLYALGTWRHGLFSFGFYVDAQIIAQGCIWVFLAVNNALALWRVLKNKSRRQSQEKRVRLYRKESGRDDEQGS